MREAPAGWRFSKSKTSRKGTTAISKKPRSRCGGRVRLRTLFSQTEDQELREKINILERAFQATGTAAVKRELDRLRRNSVTGDHLVDDLLAIYQQHRLQDLLDQRRQAPREIEIPRIVCSLAL